MMQSDHRKCKEVQTAKSKLFYLVLDITNLKTFMSQSFTRLIYTLVLDIQNILSLMHMYIHVLSMEILNDIR